MVKKEIKNKKKLTENIFVTNISNGNTVGFFTEKEAENYIENHEEPFNLTCSFNKNFERTKVEELKEKLEIIKNISEKDIEILRLISLKNPIKTIEIVLRNKNLSTADSILKLTKAELIEKSYPLGYSITKNGRLILNEKDSF